MDIKTKLENILASPRLRENSKSFVSSLLEQSQKRELSENQLSYVEKFYVECFPDPSTIQAENDWISSFTDEMRENTSIIGEYYSAFYPSSRIAKNYKIPGWIPSRELYEKSVNSAYAQKTISNYKSVPKFNVGDVVRLRNTQRNRSMYNHSFSLEEALLVLNINKTAKNNFSPRYELVVISKMQEQRIYELSEDSLLPNKEPKTKNKSAT